MMISNKIIESVNSGSMLRKWR